MIETTIEQLISKIIDTGLIEPSDHVYCRNQILGLLNHDTFIEGEVPETAATIPQLLNQLIEYAVETDLISGALDAREKLDAQIMNVFLMKPSEVNKTFNRLYDQDPVKATDFFYQLSQTSNYIQTERIAKNIHYRTDTAYGKIDITINLSKPEKDPLQIKREREMKQTVKYPNCVLCLENEGYVGRTGHAARSNHRMIRLKLTDEDWFFQYSPYVYYNEHSIVLSKTHRPMKITAGTFERLLSFVEQFPHYFVGSNADLPIVGGSILSHDHYQAGRYTFGMTEAETDMSFKLTNFPTINASTLKWPMSVIRLRDTDRATLVAAGGVILAKWQNYSDPEVELLAKTDGTPHNTITPIARYRNGAYELDLVLRNNRTTAEHPDGIFHPHQDVHHIKKENIGLIEVMGLAVLPPRLKQELNEMEQYLLGSSDQIESYHKDWADQILAETDELTQDNVEQVVRKELARKFVRVLQDAGIFKANHTGKEGFKRFISSLNA